jgi:formylglycine-generating enzyme required for sulfatase activity
MAARVSSPAAVFEKVLHAFETGDLAYSDVLEQLQRVLANGGAPQELSDIVRRRESIAPLPPSAHRGILAVLNEAIERPPLSPTPGVMELETEAPVAPSAVFEKVLDTFETGGFTYADVLEQLKRLLGSGASPSSLVAAMRRRELIDPLPQYAHAEIMGRLQNAIQHSETSAEPGAVPAPPLPPAESTAAARAAAAERAAVVEQAAAFERLRLRAEQEQREAERTAKRHEAELRAAREALTVRETQLVALQREHARVVPGLEVRAQAAAQLERDGQELRARAAGLAAELEAARASVEAERAKARAASAALAERIAAGEQEQRRGLQAARDAERQQNEVRAARDAEIAARDAALAERDAQAGDLSTRLAELDAQLGDLSARLAERDAQLGDLNARLAERDAHLGALQQEHVRLVAALEMHAGTATEWQAERQAGRERAAVLAAELAAAHDALDTERGRLREMAEALSESHASTAAAHEQAAEARRHAELQQGESRELREALAAGSTARDRAQALLAERDTEIAERGAELVALRSDFTKRNAELVELRSEIAARNAELAELRSEFAARSAKQAAQMNDLAAASARDRVLEPPVTARVSGDAPATAFATSGVTAASAAGAASAAAGRRPTASGTARGSRRFSATGGRVALGVAVLLGAGVLWFATRAKPPVPTPPRAAAVSPAAGTVIQDCATCPAMTVVPAGKFRQGSASVGGASAFEQPLHAVLIRRPFALSTNAITVDEFRQFATATQADMAGCDTYDGAWNHVAEADWRSPGFPQTGTHPVSCVSWSDAQRYAQWLSARTGHHYRLPSASEWEYAAFAGGQAEQPWSSKRTDACEHANVADRSAARRYPGWTAFPCEDGFVYTAPVGSFKANAFGLHDMLGNVFQWTQDCWHPDYRGAPIDGSARTDGDCSEHELRGGSWFSNPGFVRANYRNHFATDYRTSTVGIRLVRDLEP